MITVHHLNNSRSQRVLWMLEELGLAYDVRHYQRDPQTLFAPTELRQIHTLGKSPTLEDNGLVLVESGAILEYLVEKTNGMFGPTEESEAVLRYRMFMHYAEGSVMPPLLLKLVLARIPVMGRIAIKRIQPMIDIHLDYIEAELSRRAWFAGNDITAADVMMSFPIEAARNRGGLNESRPYTLAWLAKIQARPAYQRAIKVGGPYAYG